MALQDKLDALKLDFETNIAPPPVVEGLHRAVAELIASGAPDRALKAGDVAPAFTLPDENGKPVSSKDLLARGPLVVSFYRGVWCPYCNLELAALEAARAEIEARGATLVSISMQTPVNSRKAARNNNVGFSILSDQGGEVTNQYGVRWHAPDYLQEIHKAVGADLTQFNGDDSWNLAMPARYVIGTDGVIVFAEVNADYTQRPDPSELFPVLDRLRQ
uniref:thioredoxin-dependent peroxiredoxin n=1 Tax=Caulobacter sp. (strain K31) TaxID=366602 RepID=B0T999_CAUSK